MNSVLYSVFVSLLLKMSIITVFILAIKAAFRYKLSASMHSAMWLILGAQFVFCVFNIRIQADTSIYNYITPETRTIINAGVQRAVRGFDIRNAAAFLWFFGAAVMIIWYLYVYIRHRMEIRSLPRVTERPIINTLIGLKSELGISSDITLRFGETAQTTGSTIIIPEHFAAEELKQIMLHELCHYKNKDCLKLWLAIIIVSFNWFNPLIWYAFRVFRTDIEMLCDDRVIKLTDSRKCYATALVHSSMAKSRFIPGTTSLHNGKREVTKRVKRLVSWKKKKPIWAFIAAIVCVGMSCMCLTDAVTAAVESKVDIAKTPEPIKDISEVIPVPDITAQPDYTDEPEPDYADEPESAERADGNVYADGGDYADGGTYAEPRSYDQAEPQYIPPEESAGAESAPEVEIGASRDDIYGAMGEPESASQNGLKETYELDDGTTAVLQYEEDGTLEYGYIIEPSEAAEQDYIGDTEPDHGGNADAPTTVPE